MQSWPPLRFVNTDLRVRRRPASSSARRRWRSAAFSRSAIVRARSVH